MLLSDLRLAFIYHRTFTQFSKLFVFDPSVLRTHPTLSRFTVPNSYFITKIFSMFTSTSSKWIGILRLTPVILGSILLFSLINFGLAVTYAKQLYDAPKASGTFPKTSAGLLRE